MGSCKRPRRHDGNARWPRKGASKDHAHADRQSRRVGQGVARAARQIHAARTVIYTGRSRKPHIHHVSHPPKSTRRPGCRTRRPPNPRCENSDIHGPVTQTAHSPRITSTRQGRHTYGAGHAQRAFTPICCATACQLSRWPSWRAKRHNSVRERANQAATACLARRLSAAYQPAYSKRCVQVAGGRGWAAIICRRFSLACRFSHAVRMCRALARRRRPCRCGWPIDGSRHPYGRFPPCARGRG